LNQAIVTSPDLRQGVEADSLPLAMGLLWHDHLEAAHAIAQGVDTADGSFVHAIMHRREPDYWNAKYWWRQTGRHPAFLPLARRAAELLDTASHASVGPSLIQDGMWRPAAFVDACKAVAGRAPDEPEIRLLRELQRVEFEVLLQYLLER
jgi:hypothetical protein